jgi:hypothetical protein
MNDHLTDDFFALSGAGVAPAELWLQWEPAVDDAPILNRIAWREGDDLLIKVQSLQPRPLRRLPHLAPETWEGLSGQFELVLASLSGIVGRQRIALGDAAGQYQRQLPGMGAE